MENYRIELNALVDKLDAKIVDRQNEYQDYLEETGLSASAYTFGEFKHIQMEIDGFRKQIAIAEYHTSTVPNLTLTYNYLINKLNAIVFKSLTI